MCRASNNPHAATRADRGESGHLSDHQMDDRPPSEYETYCQRTFHRPVSFSQVTRVVVPVHAERQSRNLELVSSLAPHMLPQSVIP